MNNFLKFLKEEVKNKNKVFNNDFSSIYYIVINQQRVTQLEYELFYQMRNSRDESIIPPRILNYKYAFLEIACMLKYGKIFDKEKMTLFSQEWISFLMLKTAREVIYNSERYSSEEKMITLLSYSFERLLRYKILNIKFNENFENIQDDQDLTKELISAYQKYGEIIKPYENNEIFLTPLDAYKWLYDNIEKVKNEFYKLGIVIFIEDIDDMEPLFRNVAEELGFKKINNQTKEKIFLKYRDNEAKTKEIYAFNSIYDEAESIVASIYRDIKDGNLLNHRIVIVPFNSNLKKALNLTFYRWNMRLKSEIYLSETDEYKLFYLCYALKTEIYSGDIERFLDIFKLNCSYLKINNGLNLLKDEFYKLGYKSKQIIEFKKMLKNFFDIDKSYDRIKNIYENSETDKKKKTLEFLLNKEENFKLVDMVEKIFLEDKQIIDLNVLELIYDVAEEIDKIDEKSNLDYKDKMLLIELAGRRKVLYNIEPIIEDKNIDENNFKYANFFIPIIEPEYISNFSFDKIYLCGLDASFDKVQPHELPKSIEEKLEVLSPQENKKKIFNNVISILNRNCNLWVSYSYYSQSSRDVSGVSSLYMVLKEKLNANDLNDGYLWKYTNMITEKRLPKHFSYGYKESNNNTSTQNNQEGVLRNYTLYDLISIAYGKENNIPKLPIKKLAVFSLCPRKFIYEIFTKIASIKEIDLDGRINIANGEFWHNVFKIAFEKYKDEFNSTDINKITESLIKAKEELKEQIDIFSESFDIFEMDFKMKVNLLAKKEKERRDCGLITEYVEKNLNEMVGKEIELEISDGKKIILTGRIDRIDKDKDSNLVFFDYKNKIERKNLIIRSNGNLYFRDEHSTQVLLYAYFYTLLKGNNVKPALISYQNGNNTELNILDDVKKNFISGFIDKLKELCNLQVSTLIKENNKMKRFYCGESICQNNEHNFCPYKEICFIENENTDSYISSFFSYLENQDNRG